MSFSFHPNKQINKTPLDFDAGEGVGVSVTSYARDDLLVSEVEYCAYSKLHRTISTKGAGEFELCMNLKHSGISYIPTRVDEEQSTS